MRFAALLCAGLALADALVITPPALQLTFGEGGSPIRVVSCDDAQSILRDWRSYGELEEITDMMKTIDRATKGLECVAFLAFCPFKPDDVEYLFESALDLVEDKFTVLRVKCGASSPVSTNTIRSTLFRDELRNTARVDEILFEELLEYKRFALSWQCEEAN